VIGSTSNASNVYGVVNDNNILIGIWLWMQWKWIKVMSVNIQL
jgi:hypothetical protein